MAYIGAEPAPGQNRAVDDISSSFNGSTTAFTLQVSGVNFSPESANNILVSLGGVMQKPGTDYTIAAATITFTTAPASGLSFWALMLGDGIDTATVADQTIGPSKLLNTAVTAGSYTTADITVDAQGRITAAASGSISGAEIADGAVTNAKVNASAAIDYSKLATLADGNILVGNGSGVATSVNPSGDIDISNTGAFSIASGAIVNADVNASAAIAKSKLASLDIVNADVNSSAAIAGSKISPDFGSQNVVTTGTLGSGDLTVSSAAPKITFTDSNDNPDYLVQINGGGFLIHDSTNSADRIKIDSSGNVGIGTASPSEILHVKAASETISSRDGVILGTTDSLAADKGLPLVWNAHIGTDADYGVASICGRKENSTSDNGAGYLQFGTGTGPGAITERLRIDSSGRLLVGHTTGNGNPQLSISGNTAGASGAGMIFLRRGLDRATIGSNVGADLAEILVGDLDGNVYVSIQGKTDAATGSNDFPGRLIFATTKDGGSSPSERTRITSKGEFEMGNHLASGNILKQISRASGNTTETITPVQLGLDDNNYVLLYIVISGTALQDWGHSLVSWRMPRGGNSALVTQIDSMASGSSVATFTQAVSGNNLVINKDSDLDLNVTAIGGGGRRTTIGWG